METSYFKNSYVNSCILKHQFQKYKNWISFTSKKFFNVKESSLRNDISMANVEIYKYLLHIFALALTISEIYNFKYLTSKSR